jgi:hypothetical protein
VLNVVPNIYTIHHNVKVNCGHQISRRSNHGCWYLHILKREPYLRQTSVCAHTENRLSEYAEQSTWVQSEYLHPV